MKKCSKCGIALSDENAERRSAPRASEFRSTCRACRRAQEKASYWWDPEKHREADREARKNNPGRRQKQYQTKLKRVYGMLDADYQRLKEGQKCACAICKEPFLRTPHVDHCHKDGSVRGLLCRKCNLGLGSFDDSPERLRAAAAYLEAAHKKVAETAPTPHTDLPACSI